MGDRTISRREFLKLAGVAGATIGAGAGLGGLIAACGGGAGATTTTTTTAAPVSTTATTAAAVTTTSAAPATTATTAAQNTTTTAAAALEGLPPDPDKVIATLPPELQQYYVDYPGEVRATPWASFAGTPGPWKVGLVGLAANSAWTVNLYNEVERLFNEAKTTGLVTGDLMKGINPDQATETAAMQIASLQSMVRNGVQGVIMLPLSTDAVAPAITEAGEKNEVPVIVLGNMCTSLYSVPMVTLNQKEAHIKLIEQLGGKGKVLLVRGIPGVPWETATYDMIMAQAKKNPGIDIIGEVTGNWNNANAKTAVLQFLAGYPTDLDAVFQCGIMGQGIIQAFEQSGRKVPPIALTGAQAGDLAWFADHVKDGYQTYGMSYNGAQTANAAFRILGRILAGKQLKVRDMPMKAVLVDKNNVAKFVPPGATINTVDDPLGDPLDYCPDSLLDMYFKNPGNAEPPK
jgi:ribose transport system substrate-binding protein